MKILQRDDWAEAQMTPAEPQAAAPLIRAALDMLVEDYGRSDLDCVEIREAYVDEFGEWHDDCSDDEPDGYLVAVRLKSGGSETVCEVRELSIAEDVEALILRWLADN